MYSGSSRQERSSGTYVGETSDEQSHRVMTGDEFSGLLSEAPVSTADEVPMTGSSEGLTRMRRQRPTTRLSVASLSSLMPPRYVSG